MSPVLDDILEELLGLDPVRASMCGEDRLELSGGVALGHRLPDFSKTGQAADARTLQQLENKLATEEDAGAADALDATGRVDLELVRDEVALRQAVARYLDPVHRDPVLPLEMVGLGVRLAPDEEARAARLAAVPEFLQAAGEALRAGAVRGEQLGVPARWCETALSMASGVATLCRGAGAHGEAAARTVESFAVVVDQDVVPKAKGREASGPELLGLMMARMHGETRPLGDLLRDAVAAVEAAQAAVTEAEANAGEDNAPDVKEIADAAPFLEEIRQAAGSIVTIPEGDSVALEETPAWARPVIPVASYVPGGRLFLTLPLWRPMLTVAFAHEGYPGHHVQALRSAAAASRTRRALTRPALHEGWAYESEHRLADVREETPAERMLRLRLQLLRALRWQLDLELHLEARPAQDCEKVLQASVGLGLSHARAEVVRLGRRPGQGSAFELGRRAIERMRTAAGGDARAFHDRLLDLGHVRLDQAASLLGLEESQA